MKKTEYYIKSKFTALFNTTQPWSFQRDLNGINQQVAEMNRTGSPKSVTEIKTSLHHNKSFISQEVSDGCYQHKILITLFITRKK